MPSTGLITAKYVTTYAGDVVQQGSGPDVRNVISHFAYSNSRHPALRANGEFAYHWIIKDWQVKSCQQM